MGKSTFDSLFKTDADKSSNGIWQTIGYNDDGEECQVLVAEINNPKYEKSYRKYQKQLERARNDNKRYHSIFSKVINESILIDWKGFKDDSGETIVCNSENKLDMLTKHRRFFMEVMAIATEPTNYVDDEDEEPESPEITDKESAENLSNASSGT